MFCFKKSLLLVGAAALLLSGCKAAEVKPEGSTREVSSERRDVGKPGLQKEEWRESGVSYEDAPIEFQDEVIEEMLRNIIGKPEGEVYISELQGIHAIYCGSKYYYSNLQSSTGLNPNVTGEGSIWETKQPDNLNDLAYCYNLQWLSMGFDVPSLEPLYDLPQLEAINFYGTSLKKEVLAEIGNLPVLKRLAFGTKEQINLGALTDGEFLLPLADQLTILYAEGGIDWNPEILAQMTELEVLFIDYADDLSFLEHLTKLKKLYMYCCTTEDWSPLGKLENLEQLRIIGNMKMTVNIDLEDLSPITQLDYLELLFTSINDEYSREEIISALPGLPGLVTQY